MLNKKITPIAIALSALLFVKPVFGQSIETAKSDSVLASSKHKLTIFPVVSYSPETSVSFGTKAIFVLRPEGSFLKDRPTSFSFTFFYTLKKQIISTVRTDIWRNHNRDHWQSNVNFNNYPYVFFGIGNHAPEEAEEKYTSRSWDGFVQYEHKVSGSVYIGGRYDFRKETISNTKEGGLLATGQIEGSKGTTISGIGPTLSYDTRNHLYVPSRGSFHQATAQLFGKGLGSTTNFRRYQLDFRRYIPVWVTGIIALQAQFTTTSGQVPFQYLAAIGGGTVLRGYLNARYRDSFSEVFQAEFRRPLFWRIGAVAFVAAGKVAPEMTGLVPKSLHPAGGLGLRYRLNDEGINLRVDAALSKSMPAVYFSLYEAF